MCRSARQCFLLVMFFESIQDKTLAYRTCTACDETMFLLVIFFESIQDETLAYRTCTACDETMFSAGNVF